MALFFVQNTKIDFTNGEVQPDGSVCVVVEEVREKVEQEEEVQCSQQQVQQCYNDFTTQYRDSVRERCQEVFIKTCRIEMRPRAYNHTSRICRRPLVQQCPDYYSDYHNQGGGGGEVCRELQETVCNSRAGTGLGCRLEGRRVCAPDHCRLVEGEEECEDRVEQAVLEVPEQECSLQPQRECRNRTVSLPQLVAGRVCRPVSQQLCRTVLLPPSTVTQTQNVTYCLPPPPSLQQAQPRQDRLAATRLTNRQRLLAGRG